MRAIACLSIAALLLSACHGERKDSPAGNHVSVTPTGTPQTRQRSPAPATFVAIDPAKARYAARSTIPTFLLYPIDAVPRIEQSTEVGGCGDWGVIEPKSAGGKLAHANGWKIAAEAKLGQLTAVVILRHYLGYPGNECLPVGGRIVLFEGSTPVAVLHRQDQPPDYPVGWIEAMEGGVVRVMTSTPQVPFGDLTFDGASIRFGPMPVEDSECGGRMKVPNVFRMKIDDARRKMFRAGFKPVRQRHELSKDPTVRDPTYFDYRDRGIVEWEACGGRGWCQFQYGSPAGGLTVVTGPASEKSGLMEWVIGTSAECAALRAGRNRASR